MILEAAANLLGSPTFEELPNGRFRCVETGHELLSRDREFYSSSRRCRLDLIDFALSLQKSPLNLFKQDPLCRSKLICKLTGDTVNKSEEHIWKHINGRRFLNKEKEADHESGDKIVSHKESRRRIKVISCRNNKGQEPMLDEIQWEVRKPSGMDSDDQESSGSDSDSKQESDETSEDYYNKESEELSVRTKRLSIEVGPSNFASRKKKPKNSLLL